MTALQAIKAKCLDCSAGNKNEVKYCPVISCPLFHYRDGHNPARKGKGCNNIGKYNEEKKSHSGV